MAASSVQQTIAVSIISLLLSTDPAAALNSQPDVASSSVVQTLRSTPVFEEPLIPTKLTSADENAALITAVTAYQKQASPDDLAVFENFLTTHPESGWRVTLLLNMGLANYHYGYFSRAIDSWEQAWKEGKDAKDHEGKLQVDRAVGELLRMHARLGHKDRLTSLMADLGDRPLTGQSTEALAGAKEGLWSMENDHGIAYLCGPMALKNLMLAEHRTQKDVSFINKYRAGVDGVSLAEVSKLAEQGKQPHTMVYREANASIPLPAIVHWKVNHFATILSKEHGRYHIADPTFGTDLWITENALNSESSGYFLLPDTQVPAGFKPVTVAQAETVRGRGLTTNNEAESTKPSDDKGKPKCKSCPSHTGMVEANFHSMVLSLNLTDTPIGYAPPKGPSVFVTLTYNQREINQPAIFNFSNVSPKWTFNWLSYVQDDPGAPSANVFRYVAGGGTQNYTGYSSATGNYVAESANAATLTRIPGPPVSYRRVLADGSVEIYGHSDGATSAPRRIFLTKVTDPAGNSVTLNYDTQHRLVSISDALGQSTTFSYGVVGSPLLISAITDPFGRSAQIDYDSAGHLKKITDVVGITSQFSYDPSGLVNSMTTPYGTTSFAFGGSGVSRWLEITDPLGQTERAEFRQQAPGIPYSEPALPTGPGLHIFNLYVDSRNTFYWDKSVYPTMHTDYTKAGIKHWLHRTLTLTAPVLEGIKNPLESRVWYSYPGQPVSGSPPVSIYAGTLDKPSVSARLRDDGTTELSSTSYNSLGLPLTVTDPMGNQTLYDYDTNQIDVIRVRQKTGASTYMTLAEYTYNTQHKPYTYKDANGQITTFFYNADGQLHTITDPLSHVTTYNYDANGYLTSITDANGQTAWTISYDGYGRIATRTDAGGNTLTYQYDNLNRITKLIYPDSTYYEYTFNKLDLASMKDRLGRVTTYSYDANRNLRSVTDPAGHATQYTYYPNDKLNTKTDPNGGVTTWGRDIQGRVTSISDPKGVVTNFTFDGVGNIKKIDSPDSGTTQFTYNAGKHLTKKVDGRGITTNYAYDWMNRLIGVSYPASPLENVSYIYDYNSYDSYENNRLTYLQDNNGYTVFGRDAEGRVIGKANWLTTASTYFGYDYDNTDRLTQVTYPSGRVVLYTRNALGQITQVQTQDDSSSPFYTLASDISYAPFGPLKKIKFGNGVITTFQRDAENRPTHVETTSTPNLVRDYTYDTAGNISSIADPIAGMNRSYSYDVLDRVTADTNVLMPGTFQYDANDNRTGGSLSGSPFSVGYSSTSNRQADWMSIPVTVDAGGNLTGGGIGPMTYSYNNANRLSQASDGATTTTYLYNGFGQRTTKQNSDSMHYDYLPDGNYADVIKVNPDGSYAEVTEYIWLEDTPIGQIKTTYATGGAVSNRVMTYIHADHLNTPRAMTNAAKTVVWLWENDVFGMLYPLDDPDGDGIANRLDLGFPGQIRDIESSLFYNRNRYYDPAMGRYTQPDPIGLNGGFNLYRYAFSSPLRYSDRRGLSSCPGGIPEAACDAAELKALAIELADEALANCDIAEYNSQMHIAFLEEQAYQQALKANLPAESEPPPLPVDPASPSKKDEYAPVAPIMESPDMNGVYERPSTLDGLEGF